MESYLLKRILSAIPVGIGSITLVALFIHSIPGSPVDALLGEYATHEEKQALILALGLHKSFFQQWFDYLLNLCQGDLGQSLIYHRPVVDLMRERLPATFELAVLSLFIAVTTGTVMGTIAAMTQNTLLTLLIETCSLIFVAIPNFWLGPMLVLLFSIELGLLPVSERSTYLSYILPATTLGLSLSAIICRMTHNAVLESLHEKYVQTARSKGLKESRIIAKHIGRNAASPVTSIIGLQFGVLLSGSAVTEKVFDWPGLGSLLVQALNDRDYPLVQGCVLLFAFTYQVVNIGTDIIYSLLDPRIKLQGGKVD